MKNLMIFAILTSFFSFSAFAVGETETECPMMKEMNKRVNTKLNLDKNAKRPGHVRGSRGKGA